MLRKSFLLCLSISLCICLSHRIYAEVTLAEGLERQMWVDMKSKNWDNVSARISSNFQSVHTDGIRNKAQQMTLIRNLNVGNYVISNFRVTESNNTYIVTYDIIVKENIDDKQLSFKPTPRLSVWQSIDGIWQWVAHANLNPVKNPKRYR